MGAQVTTGRLQGPSVAELLARHPKSKLRSDLTTRLPLNAVLFADWLLGSAVPVTREHMQSLLGLGVGTIVTLISTPLTEPRLVNCSSGEQRNPEFCDREPDLLADLAQVHLEHMPMADGGTPTRAQAQRFLDLCAAARARQQLLLVHCWQGERRTWCMARLALRDAGCAPPQGGRSTPWIDQYLLGSSQERVMLCLLAASLALDRSKLGELFTAPSEHEPQRQLGAELLSRWDALCAATLLAACSHDRALVERVQRRVAARSPSAWQALFEAGPRAAVADAPAKRTAVADAPAKRIKPS